MLLSVFHLTIGYDHKVVQKNLNLTLKRGEMVCMLGKNGCGKSTLLRTLAGIQKPTEGHITLYNNDKEQDLFSLSTNQRAKTIALVLTERESLASTKVKEIVSMGRYPYTNFVGQNSQEDNYIVQQAMQQIGIEDKSDEYFNSLSDGEKQRVLIAKAIAQQTPLILLDEPTAHLDLPNRIKTMRLLQILAHDKGISIIISTHELDLALQTADSIWLMSDAGVETYSPQQLTDSDLQTAFNDKNVVIGHHKM